MSMEHLFILIMAGGRGERFWPLSTEATPKHLLRLIRGKSLIRNTYETISRLVAPSKVYVVTSIHHVARVREDVPEIPSENVVGEPLPRDTAACVGLGALLVSRRDPDGVMLVLPADHVISPRREFERTLKFAYRKAARSDCLITFGIVPRYAATRFGYIEPKRVTPERVHQRKLVRSATSASTGTNANTLLEVKAFVEKPGVRTAKRLVKRGCFWNSGIFMWRADAILREIREFLPQISRGLEQIRERMGTDGECTTIQRVYEKLPRISIDYGVMEKSKRVKVIPANFMWNDVGSFDSIEELLERRERTNSVQGDVTLLDTTNSIAINQEPGHILALYGLRHLIVVHTRTATLICAREKAEDLKRLVAQVNARSKIRHGSNPGNT